MMEMTRWTQLLSRLRLNHDVETFQKLHTAYGEKHRAYHTAVHIEHCLANLDRSVELLTQPDTVELAIWFHDAIYRPYSTSNEEDSANWAAKFISEAGGSLDLAAHASQLIIATRHDVPLDSHDQSVLVDIDLAILGSESSSYDQFEEDVRTEYRFVPKFIFKKKRVEILQGFLNREYIYQNDWFRKQYECKARENLESAVTSLLR